MSKSNGNKGKPRDIGKIMREGVLIDQAMKKAARAAVLAHKRAGKPLVVWRDGRIKRVKP